ncbi:MAG: hypothetical protein M1826_006182 [Phylliscum demangeonii]|nr:MAG: hypothetical protein M1826_006182 [Phylliscum demangeonii]
MHLSCYLLASLTATLAAALPWAAASPARHDFVSLQSHTPLSPYAGKTQKVCMPRTLACDKCHWEPAAWRRQAVLRDQETVSPEPWHTIRPKVIAPPQMQLVKLTPAQLQEDWEMAQRSHNCFVQCGAWQGPCPKLFRAKKVQDNAVPSIQMNMWQ